MFRLINLATNQRIGTKVMFSYKYTTPSMVKLKMNKPDHIKIFSFAVGNHVKIQNLKLD
jgi:hypothetical protein